MSLVVEIMQQYKAALLNQERDQMASMARHWMRLESELQDKVELFARRVIMDGLSPSQIQSRQFQLDRYRSLLQQVRAELDKYTDYADDLITQRQGEIGRAGIRIAEQAIDAIGADNGIKIAYDRLPTEAIQNMAGLAGDGSPLRDLLMASYGDGADGMLSELIGATARGQNPQVTARAMLRNGLSRSLSRMLNVARTEQLRVGREASRMAYQESGVVEAYRRLATKDDRACIACIMADGEVYELSETLREHPQGRCTLLPIVTGMPLAEWEKGRDWFQKADPAMQRKILGPGKFEAWEDGKFDLDQVVAVRRNSTWGDTLQPRSLKSLLNGNPRPFVVRDPDPDREIRPPTGIVQPEPTPEPAPTPEPTPQVTGRTAEETQGELFKVRDKYADRIRQAEDLKRRYESSSGDLQRLMDRQDEILVESVGASAERKKALGKESRQVNKQIKEIRKLRDTYNPQQYRDVSEERAKEARKLLEVDDPASNVMHLRLKENAGTIADRRARDGLAFLNSVVSREIMDGVDYDVHVMPDGSRASYDEFFKAINVSNTESLPTVVHEFAHAIEYENPGIFQKAKAWRDRRTQGESYQPLRSLVPGSGYRDNERAQPDRFLDPYIGKDNGDKSSEVVTMGLQYMYEDPIKFAEDDPDMFGFIHDLVRGRDTSRYGDVDRVQSSTEPARVTSADDRLAELQARQDEVFGLYRKAGKNTDEAKRLKEESARLRREIEQAEQQIERQRTEARRLRSLQAEPGTAEGARKRLAEMDGELAGHRKEISRAKARYEALTAEIEAAMGRMDYEAISAASEQRERIARELRDLDTNPPVNVREAVYVNEPANVKMRGTQRDNHRRGVEEFNRLVSRGAWDGGEIEVEELGDGERAYHSPEKIHVTAGQDIATIVHELGHELEAQGGANERIRAFFERRTQGDDWEKLRALTGRDYRDSEVAKKDQWLDPYMGKYYANPNSTEIVSMGVELMYKDPAMFAKEDPDMFDFIFDLLRGR